MTIYNKAKELAAVLKESEELKAFKDAEAAMLCDPQARKLVEEYQKYQSKYLVDGVPKENISEEEKKNIDDLEEKMSQNVYIVAFMEAQEAVEAIIRSINIIISGALTDNEESCSSGCCSGCSGCS